MKSFDPAVVAQLAAGKIKRRSAILFDLPSGRFGFIMGFRGTIATGGVTYLGSGGLISVERPKAGLDGTADDLFVTLASHYRINGQWHQLFEPTVLNTIEDEIWFRRPAIVYRMWFDASRRLIGSPEQTHRREIYKIEHLKGGPGKRIRGTLSTPAALARVVEAKKDGPELQRLVDPADRGYDHLVSAAVETVNWGRGDPRPLTNGQSETGRR